MLLGFAVCLSSLPPMRHAGPGLRLGRWVVDPKLRVALRRSLFLELLQLPLHFSVRAEEPRVLDLGNITHHARCRNRGVRPRRGPRTRSPTTTPHGVTTRMVKASKRCLGGHRPIVHTEHRVLPLTTWRQTQLVPLQLEPTELSIVLSEAHAQSSGHRTGPNRFPLQQNVDP